MRFVEMQFIAIEQTSHVSLHPHYLLMQKKNCSKFFLFFNILVGYGSSGWLVAS